MDETSYLRDLKIQRDALTQIIDSYGAPGSTPPPSTTQPPTTQPPTTPPPTTAPPTTPPPVSGGTHPRLASLAANAALDLGPYTCTQMANDRPCNTITDYSGLVLDPMGRRLLMFGGGHGATERTDVDALSLAPSAPLTWAPLYASTAISAMTSSNADTTRGKWNSTNHPFARHTYDMNVVAGGYFLVLAGISGNGDHQPATSTKIAKYNLSTNQWMYTGTAPWRPEGSAALDPASGKVIVIGTDNSFAPKLWSYDPATEVISTLTALVPDPGYANHLVLYPPTGKLYLFMRGSPVTVLEITLGSTPKVVAVTGMTGTPNSKETGYAYDAGSQLIGGNVANNQICFYNPATKAWTTRTPTGANVGTLAFHAIDYDPVNGVFLFVTEGRKSIAYRYGAAPVTTPPPITTPPPVTTPPPTTTPPPSGGGGTRVMPTIADEQAAYQRWGWTFPAKPNYASAGSYSVSDIDVHGDTEGDDLWTNHWMYVRGGGAGYQQRAAAWARYFKDDFVQCVGSSSKTMCYDAGFLYDHAWGWGLIDYATHTGNQAYLTAAENVGDKVETYWATRVDGGYPEPGVFAMNYYGARGPARHLILATRLTEATGKPRWRALRDRLIDLWVRSPDWDDTRGMSWVGDYQTDAMMGSGSFAQGIRVTSGFEQGWLAEALWLAYLATGRADIRPKLVSMARYLHAHGLDPTSRYTGYRLGHDNGVSFNDAPSYVYTICQVNALVRGYQLTGDAALLEDAKTFWQRGVNGVYGSLTERRGPDGTVSHFVDSEFDTSYGNFYFAHNKGELQYTYGLFENGGQPPRVA